MKTKRKVTPTPLAINTALLFDRLVALETDPNKRKLLKAIELALPTMGSLHVERLLSQLYPLLGQATLTRVVAGG